MAKFLGGGQVYQFEPQVLTGSVVRKVTWVKGFVDMAELARLRQSQNLTTDELAAHFRVGRTTIVDRIRRLSSTGD